MGGLTTRAPVATDAQGTVVEGLARTARRTNLLLVVLAVVLIASTGLLVDLALQLDQGNVSIASISEQKACGDAQAIADYRDGGVALGSTSATTTTTTPAQSQRAAALGAAVGAFADDAAGAGDSRFARAARELVESYLDGDHQASSPSAPVLEAARTIDGDCRAAGYPVISRRGPTSLAP